MKIQVGDNYWEIKDDLEKLMNDIISTKEGSLIYLIDNVIKFYIFLEILKNLNFY